MIRLAIYGLFYLFGSAAVFCRDLCNCTDCISGLSASLMLQSSFAMMLHEHKRLQQVKIAT